MEQCSASERAMSREDALLLDKPRQGVTRCDCLCISVAVLVSLVTIVGIAILITLESEACAPYWKPCPAGDGPAPTVLASSSTMESPSTPPSITAPSMSAFGDR
jgi:hypothetical protein